MKIIKLLAVTVVALISQTLFAGFQLDIPVTFGNGYFYGDLRSTRDSANNTEYLSCYTNSQTNSVSCYARNAASQFRSCTIAAPDAGDYAAVSAVSSSSYVIVYHNDNGQCTRIQTYNGSYSLP